VPGPSLSCAESESDLTGEANRLASVAVKHTAHGYWIEEAGAPEPAPPLAGDREFDVLIVGGGFTGMWTAWHLHAGDPDLKIALLESGVCGHGPSGRNGGFAEGMWAYFKKLSERYGEAAAFDIGTLAERSVDQIAEFLDAEGIDAWYRRSGYMNVSTSPSQDGAWDEQVAALNAAGLGDHARVLTAEGVEEVCHSPRFRGGVLFDDTATLQPARLAFGLRRRLMEEGVSVFENSPVVALDDGPSGVTARTRGGSIRAARAVLASGAALAGFGSPVRDKVTIASSHMVITEPVPDVLEKIGWDGAPAITDCRSLLNYFRTTPDGRIAFGWGGGKIAAGGRRGGTAEVDADVISQVAGNLTDYFPDVKGRELTHAWGGPIDASASHLPHVVSLPSGRTFAAFGYTGNGVGPTQMIGRTLASLCLDRRDEYTALALVEPPSNLTTVPPEPFRWIGGTVIRDAIHRKEKAELLGEKPGIVTSAIAAVPGLIGFHIGR